jgi:hypothetical protein
MQNLPVRNSHYQLASINCCSCGAVVAVHEAFNVNVRLEAIGKKIGLNLRG